MKKIKKSENTKKTKKNNGTLRVSGTFDDIIFASMSNLNIPPKGAKKKPKKPKT